MMDLHKLAICCEALGRREEALAALDRAETSFCPAVPSREQAEQMCRQRGVESLKIDTHQDNTSMRRLLEKHHYQYCGVIQLHRDLSLRVAYEKRLDEK